MKRDEQVLIHIPKLKSYLHPNPNPNPNPSPNHPSPSPNPNSNCSTISELTSKTGKGFVQTWP